MAVPYTTVICVCAWINQGLGPFAASTINMNIRALLALWCGIPTAHPLLRQDAAAGDTEAQRPVWLMEMSLRAVYRRLTHRLHLPTETWACFLSTSRYSSGILNSVLFHFPPCSLFLALFFCFCLPLFSYLLISVCIFLL
jgi:hypothetical protein